MGQVLNFTILNTETHLLALKHYFNNCLKEYYDSWRPAIHCICIWWLRYDFVELFHS